MESNKKEEEAKKEDTYKRHLVSQTLRHPKIQKSSYNEKLALFVTGSGGTQEVTKANNEIRTMAFWEAARMIQYGSGESYYYNGYAASAAAVDAPTYLGQPPYIGLVPPPSVAHLGPRPHPLSTHVLTSRVPSSPDSPPERPVT